MDLKNFAKQGEKEESNVPKEGLDDVKEKYGAIAQDFISKYGQMSENEMLAELFKLIQQKKKDGTFNAEEIKKASIHIAPLLNESQKEYMNNLLKYLD